MYNLVEQDRKTNRKTKQRMKRKSKLKYLWIIVPIFVIMGAVYGIYSFINGKIYVPTPKDFFKTEEEKKAAEYEEEQGIINILLIGLDGRKNETYSNTDSIILATIDTNNKRVKLTSFMRDMYVPIPGRKDNRINSAFAAGGPELLLKTINNDFGLNLQYYASINFGAFQELVEKLGGVEVDVKEKEIKEINKYIMEVNGSNGTLLTTPGFQTLNGQQALSYCRIRHVGNNDYERTERQRRVLTELIKKAKKTSIVKLPELFTAVLPYVKTNLQTTRIMNLAYTVYRFGNIPVDNMRIPYDGTFEGRKIRGMDVLVPDLEKNAAMLDRFIFSGSGSIASNMPVYMANNFHANDKPIDNRNVKKEIPKIVIPVEAPVIPVEDINKDKNGYYQEDPGSTEKPGNTENPGGTENPGSTEDPGSTDPGNTGGDDSGSGDNGGEGGNETDPGTGETPGDTTTP